MGCGTKAKKAVKDTTAFMATGGLSETKKIAKEADRASDGKLAELGEQATGGAIQSQETKDLIAQGRQAEAEQQMEVERIESEQAKKDEKRRLRTTEQKKGRRSLLWQGGTELGVEKRATKLGGM